MLLCSVHGPLDSCSKGVFPFLRLPDLHTCSLLLTVTTDLTLFCVIVYSVAIVSPHFFTDLTCSFLSCTYVSLTQRRRNTWEHNNTAIRVSLDEWNILEFRHFVRRTPVYDSRETFRNIVKTTKLSERTTVPHTCVSESTLRYSARRNVAVFKNKSCCGQISVYTGLRIRLEKRFCLNGLELTSCRTCEAKIKQ